MKPLFIARQGKRPTGLLGHIVARIMAAETSPENDRALDLLSLRPDDRLVDVGCGHGVTIAKAARVLTSGHLAGIDFSPLMIAHATSRNKALVKAGRVSLHLGSSGRLPFLDGAFTRALSVHTIYFWQDPVAHLKEIRRVLEPGGRFVLGFRTAEDLDFISSYPSQVYTIRRKAEILGLMDACGFKVLDDVTAHLGRRQVVLASALA